jgi:hypothetical protein
VRWTQHFEGRPGARKARVDVTLAKQWIADHHDVFTGKKANPSSRTICGHMELDPTGTPFYPMGANDGKVTDSALVEDWSFWARWGHACGTPFNAKAFISKRPQYSWLDGYLKDRPRRPWTRFRGGETRP